MNLGAWSALHFTEAIDVVRHLRGLVLEEIRPAPNRRMFEVTFPLPLSPQMGLPACIRTEPAHDKEILPADVMELGRDRGTTQTGIQKHSNN
jgi:hypothetical protein